MGTSGAFVSLLKRDRAIILVALGGATALSWVYLVRMARDMAAQVCDMPGMEGMFMGAVPVWNAPYFAMMIVMWTVMMIGMMLPSAAPAILLYATMHRNSGATPYMSTASFAAGYVAVWTLFSVAAVLAQWGLDSAALLSPAMVSTSPYLGAALLAAAGVYQLTPWKNACLGHCRGPFSFFQQHWQTGRFGAFRMGTRHGAYCLACCWALMLLLFFGGVMNLVWVGAITVFVLLEKAAPFGRPASKVAGVSMILLALGVLLVRRNFF